MRRKYMYILIASGLIVTVSIVIIVTYFILNSGAVSDTSGPKLVIDHDGGADDAMAIFAALLYEQYFNGSKVIGLTTTHGNVGEPQVFENSQRILGIANRKDVKIYRGSNSALVISYESDFYFGLDGLGDNENVEYDAIEAQVQPAAIALLELSKLYPGELTVVCIGTLTNVALALKLDPNFISRLSQLYIGAGNIYSEIYNTAEFNAMMDIEAYRVVADHATADKVTVVPFSQTQESINISKQWRTDVLGNIPTDTMRALNGFEQITLLDKSEQYWNFLDSETMAFAFDNTMGITGYSNNNIILCGDNRGINTNNITANIEEANVRIVQSMDQDKYMQFLIDVFSAELELDNKLSDNL